MKRINVRRIVLAAVDLCLIVFSCFMSILLINELGITVNRFSVVDYAIKIAVYSVVTIISLLCCGVYRNIWKYAQIKDFIKCFLGTSIGFAVTIILLKIIKKVTGEAYSRIFIVMSFLITTTAIISLRTCYSWLYGFYVSQTKGKGTEQKKRTLIVGAGLAAQRTIGEMLESGCIYEPVCIVDDDVSKLHGLIRNVCVCGTIEDIPDICREKNIEVIMIAIPSCSAEERKKIIDISLRTDCEIKTLPYIHEVFNMENLVNQAKSINLDELLGRDAISFDNTEVKELIHGRTCMVTGGGGSIGSELCRQIAKYEPKRLVIVEIYENNAYDIQQELLRTYGDEFKLNVEIASVRDYDKLETLFAEYRPNLVFHAAAHKHVPLMETNPEEAVKNNILGTYNTAVLADKYCVEKFVLISTDKAVNPTNVMGATKRCCEMIVQDMAQKSKNTKFVAVRFGNVLGSNGSVIPLFEKQIAKGGPVTVTHPEIVRYFMTIPEAVSLILQSATFAKGGEIFVLDMGEPVKILTLAENLIKIRGKKPNVDIEIKFTGLRPGEKLYEELLMDEEGLRKTDNKKIFIGKQIEVDDALLLGKIRKIKESAMKNDKISVVDELADIVPTFNHKTN